MRDDYNLRQLRNFVVLAEVLSFRRAARKLNMSQPPLTRSIQQLEFTLQERLFNRTSAKVELTEAGRLFLNDAINILRSVKMASERVRSDTQRRCVTLGFVEPVSYDVIPRLFSRFQRTCPDIKLEFSQLSTLDQVHALRRNEIDIAMLRLPVDMTGLEQRTLYQDELVLALPEDHPYRGEDINLSALKGEKFVSYSRTRGEGILTATLSACARSGFKPTIVQEASSTTLLLSLVAAHTGVTLLSGRLASAPRAGVRFIKIGPKPPLSPVTLVWRKNCQSKFVRSAVDDAYASVWGATTQ